MIRLPVLAIFLLMAVMTTMALAEGQAGKRQQIKLAPVVGSKVPQAQLTTVQKRELAKQQRDKKLKVRETNSQAKGGATSLQKPAAR